MVPETMAGEENSFCFTAEFHNGKTETKEEEADSQSHLPGLVASVDLFTFMDQSPLFIMTSSHG